MKGENKIRKQITQVSMALMLVLLTLPLSPAIADLYADAVISYVEGPGVGEATQAPPNGNDDPGAALGTPEHSAQSGSGLSGSQELHGHPAQVYRREAHRGSNQSEHQGRGTTEEVRTRHTYRL